MVTVSVIYVRPAPLRHLMLCAGGVYAVLVRRQLQSAAQDSSGSLASIGEDTALENGSLQRAASEDPNADLMKRQNTGTQPLLDVPGG